MEIVPKSVHELLLTLGGIAVAVIEHEGDRSSAGSVRDGGHLRVLAREGDRDGNHHGGSLRASSEVGEAGHDQNGFLPVLCDWEGS